MNASAADCCPSCQQLSRRSGCKHLEVCCQGELSELRRLRCLVSELTDTSAGPSATPYWQHVFLCTSHTLRFNGFGDYVQLPGRLLSVPPGYDIWIDLTFRAYPPPTSAAKGASFCPVSCTLGSCFRQVLVLRCECRAEACCWQCKTGPLAAGEGVSGS